MLLGKIARLLDRARDLERIEDEEIPDPLSVSLWEFDQWLMGVEDDEKAAEELGLPLSAFLKMKADTMEDYNQR